MTSEPQSLTPAGCCNDLADGALEPAEAERLARVFKALGDRTRVRLLSIIAVQEAAEACVCDLTGPVGLSQPTVSHHLKQLVEVGLLTREQRGRWSYYRLVDEALDAVSGALGRDALSRRSS